MKKVFIALIACLCIVAMNVVSVSAFASELPIIQKLLVIIDDELSSSIPQYNTNDYIEFVDVDDFNEAYDNYISYAVSVEDSTLDNINQILRNAYEEFVVYSQANYQHRRSCPAKERGGVSFAHPRNKE